MTGILTEIISILVGGISGIASGIGSGLSTLVQAVFLDTTGDITKLSIFGGLCIVFAGVSLAVGLSRFIVNWVTTLGN